MWTQLAVANRAMGPPNIGHAPTQIAMPRVRITRPRYMGLRVNRYGPLVISLRLVGEVGSTSVPSRRKSTMAQTGGIHDIATNEIPRGASGRPGTLDQSKNQLIAAAVRTLIRAQIGGGSLSISSYSNIRHLSARPLRPPRAKSRHSAASFDHLVGRHQAHGAKPAAFNFFAKPRFIRCLQAGRLGHGDAFIFQTQVIV